MCNTVDSVVDVWHDVSAPVVDTQLGRMATNIATGGLSAPAFAAYDVSRGADPFQAAVGGALGYYGGQAGYDFFSGGDAAAVDPSSFGSWDVAGGSTGAESFGSWDVLPEASTMPAAPEMLGSSGGNIMGGSQMDVSPAATFGDMGTGTYGVDSAPTGLEMVSQGGLDPVSQGGELVYNAPTGNMGVPDEGWGLGDLLGKAKEWATPAYMAKQAFGPLEAGSSLYDMYAKRQMAQQQQNRFDTVNKQIEDYYAPGSPEEIAMRQQLERQDARSGRNSQYGARAVDLAARMAQLKMNARLQAMGSQNKLMGEQMANQYGGLNSLFANLGKSRGYANMMGG